MTAAPPTKSSLTSQQWHAVSASFLGWTLDAFDFFVLVFLIDVLAAKFQVPRKDIISTLTATLMMRPAGALLFGLLADRYGRRAPLMANVIFFSVVELLCGFAPNYTVFLVLRTIYGIGMGGEWGVGASLAMESVPTKLRGTISGIVQSGYSCGYLLAAVAAKIVLPIWGWRAMFWAGGLPALLAFYIRWKVTESESWKQHRMPGFGSIVKAAISNWKLFFYLAGMMSLMHFLSHGTQDLYPDFLKSEHGFTTDRVANMAILWNIGALLGAVIFGKVSGRFGRRRSLVAAALVALCVIPLWAFGMGLYTLAIAAFLMQMGVQGAWGIVPAHLNELSPPALRGLIPGFAYQVGILIAAPVNNIVYYLRGHVGYAWALAGFEIANIILLATVVLLGPERSGQDFLARPHPE